MLTPNYKGIVTDGLLYHTDLANELCWAKTQQVDGYEFPSVVYELPNSNGRVALKTLELPDYGLNQIDLGRVLSHDEKAIVMTEAGLVLEVLGYPYGRNFQLPSGEVDTTAGAYIKLIGKHLQGFFKLDGYDYELLPARYAKGVTLETSLLITDATFANQNQENIFLYLGTRSNNRFYTSGYTGTTSGGWPLGPDHATERELGVEGNVIAFLFDRHGHIGYRTVNDDLEITEAYSENNITRNGWVNISLSYTPCSEITDPELLDCEPRRAGFLRVYVNGILFHVFEGFEEYMFQGLETEPEKQIGVPYTIGWGGGVLTDPTPEEEEEEARENSNTLLNQYFSGYFIGGMQTLRIYDRPLSVLEARKNHNVLAPRYGLPLVKGGRVTPAINW